MSLGTIWFNLHFYLCPLSLELIKIKRAHNLIAPIVIIKAITLSSKSL